MITPEWEVDMSQKENLNLTAVFQEKTIRRAWHNEEWWFAVIDVVAALTDSADAKQYIKKMRSRDPILDANWGTTCTPLPLLAPDGKMRESNCANIEGVFRIIQSIPSPQAEPFKRWLAQVGYERVKEIENPELAMGRMQELYEKKGYPKEWIDKRLRGIAVRQDLTDEWKARGVASSVEFAILTNEIMQGTFDLKVDDYKQVKSLARENLRDHMTDIELILTMLGEATTTKLHRDRDSQGIVPLKKDAQDGGAVAGRTRKDIEQQSGKPVISTGNFKQLKAGTSKRLKKADE
jgi:prophage antirepressor-like protein